MRPVSIYEFHPKLKALGFHEVRFADSNYVAPGKDWLRDFAAFLFRKCPKYYRETYDCENIARWAMVEADMALVDSGTREAGHTFGEATGAILIDGKPAMHTMNFCYCEDETIYIIDAQVGLLVPASEYQCVWSSCRL